MSKPDSRETATHWARLRDARIPQLLGVYAGVAALALLALLVAGFMTLRALGIGPMGSLVAAGVLDWERDFSAGIALLEEAVAQDSTFAMVWRKLGVTLSNAGYPRARWEEAFTRAYENSDRLTDRERYLAQAVYHTHVLDDPDRAMVAYRTVLDTYPGETTALNNLAGILAGRGDHAGAAELYRRALAADSATIIYYTNLLNQLVPLGEWEEAEHILDRYQAWFPDLASTRASVAVFASARGDLDGAARIFREVAEDPRAGVADRIAAAEGRHEGLLAFLRRQQREGGCAWCIEPQLGQVYEQAGMPDSAIVHYERYVAGPALHRLEMDAFWLARTHERLAALYEARGDLANAIRHLERFVELREHADPPRQPRVEGARRRLTALAGS